MSTINILKIVFELVVLLGVVALQICHHYLTDPPAKPKIKCDDYSISLKYKDSTVTYIVLHIVSVSIPFLVIMFTEIVIKMRKSVAINSKRDKQTQAQDEDEEKKSVRFENTLKLKIGNKFVTVDDAFANFYVNFGAFLVGLLATAIVTDLGKFQIGRLRPHYLDVCQPFYVNSTSRSCAYKDYYYYNEDYVCQTKNLKQLRAAQLSFPSGHSSESFFAMVFIILYIAHKWTGRTVHIPKYFIQLGLFLFAYFTAMSRVMDHKHFASDVIFGSLIGVFVAILTFYQLTNHKLCEKKRENHNADSNHMLLSRI